MNERQELRAAGWRKGDRVFGWKWTLNGTHFVSQDRALAILLRSQRDAARIEVAKLREQVVSLKSERGSAAR